MIHPLADCMNKNVPESTKVWQFCVVFPNCQIGENCNICSHCMNIPFLVIKDVTALHGAEINEAVSRVVNGGWYLQGKENEKFEENYSKFIGTKYTIGCANGLDALIWIFRAYIEMGVMQPGDEVIVPANTYIATILAITENGLKPVLVEPKLNTLGD